MEIVWTYKEYRERGPNIITGKIGKNQYLQGLNQRIDDIIAEYPERDIHHDFRKDFSKKVLLGYSTLRSTFFDMRNQAKKSEMYLKNVNTENNIEREQLAITLENKLILYPSAVCELIKEEIEEKDRKVKSPENRDKRFLKPHLEFI